VPYLAFAVVRILAGAASRNNDWRYSMLEQIEGVIEAGAEYRRRAAVVLRGSKDDDSVRGLLLLRLGLADNSHASLRKPEQKNRND
jgi:hypothetical protein